MHQEEETKKGRTNYIIQLLPFFHFLKRTGGRLPSFLAQLSSACDNQLSVCLSVCLCVCVCVCVSICLSETPT